MECNEYCFSQKKTKPSYQIMVIIDKTQIFCSQFCRISTFRKYLQNDIESSIYIEKNFLQCPLCLTYDYTLLELDCEHKFCHNCIKNIFKTSFKCPICRTIAYMKSENDKISDYYRENLTSEHSKLISCVYNLINNIDYEYDLDILRTHYYATTNRDISNDIILILEYFNNFKL